MFARAKFTHFWAKSTEVSDFSGQSPKFIDDCLPVDSRRDFGYVFEQLSRAIFLMGEIDLLRGEITIRPLLSITATSDIIRNRMM